MDDQMIVVAIQLAAVASIAAAILLYLLRKVHCGRRVGVETRPVLVTGCDGGLGLQLAFQLDKMGFRVFAGCKDPNGPGPSLLAKASSALLRRLVLDVTREDQLREAVDDIRKHLPAGERGLWAVINCAGLSRRGRLESQESALWEELLRANVVGALRTSRTFLPLLRDMKGRLLLLGRTPGRIADSSLVAYSAARGAVEGAATALRTQATPLGIDVITLRLPDSLPPPEKLFTPFPKMSMESYVVEVATADGEESDNGPRLAAAKILEQQAVVVPPETIKVIESALLDRGPRHYYSLRGGFRTRIARLLTRNKQLAAQQASH